MIIFRYVKWRNFLSTGNSWTNIQLDRSSDTLIIGSNGAGKSTLLDALCFGLFGKPFRKINKPQLMNSINQKDCEVEVGFEIGKKTYRVIRGIKPNKFDIYLDGNLINQDAKTKDYQDYLEKVILKLNFKSFTQIVILGSASFVPFMQLSAADRRSIIEDLLDIRIFSSMNTLVKDKLADIKEKSRQLKFDMDLTAEKIQLQNKNIQEHKEHNEEQIEHKKTELQDTKNQIEKNQSDIVLIQKHIDMLMSSITNEDKLKNKNKNLLKTETKIETTLSKTIKELSFWETEDTCPTCTQSISDEFKIKKISEKQNRKVELETAIKQIEEEIQKNNDRLTEITKVHSNITKHNSAITEKNSTIRSLNNYITKLNSDIEKLLERKNNIIEENTHLKELKTQLSDLLGQQKNLSHEKHYYEFASSMLKDTGIKSRIIKQYLPIMNKLINKYLTALDFFVNFNIDENFQETIKSRHRDDFTYDSFSEGQKMRIDLALLFTWRQVAKMKNSTNTNLLILDEVFDSSLDAVGTEEFLKIIKEMDKGTNTFVISHKGDQLFDKFRSIIKFELKGNFSRIV